MDVGLRFFWRLDLDDKVNLGNIKASRCDIGGDQNLEFALLESLHGDLSLILSDATMHYLDVIVDGLRAHKFISISFGRREHNDLTSTTIAGDYTLKGVNVEN